MPLRPELRPLYGHAWRKYRLILIELANYTCSVCKRKLPPAELTGAHLLHDAKQRELVAIMCFPCHARHDSPQRHAMTRRTRARKFGQLWLLPEIEYAPYAAWEIPSHVFTSMQQRFPYATEQTAPPALDGDRGPDFDGRRESLPSR